MQTTTSSPTNAHWEPELYAELHRIARRLFARERLSHTLQATALVHEVFLRLAKRPEFRSEHSNQSRYLYAAATVMRRILISYSRAKLRSKRGGRWSRVSLEDGDDIADIPRDRGNLLALDRALDKLRAHRPRQARVVELKFFAGSTQEEIARALGRSLSTIKCDWAQARAWLLRELHRQGVDLQD